MECSLARYKSQLLEVGSWNWRCIFVGFGKWGDIPPQPSYFRSLNLAITQLAHSAVFSLRTSEFFVLFSPKCWCVPRFYHILLLTESDSGNSVVILWITFLIKYFFLYWIWLPHIQILLLMCHHHHHHVFCQGQVLHCMRRNLGCSSAEGRSFTANSGTKDAVLPGIKSMR